jgi:hypothetical protein
VTEDEAREKAYDSWLFDGERLSADDVAKKAFDAGWKARAELGPEDPPENVPRGVIYLLVDDRGGVAGTGYDFDSYGYGGFSKDQSKEIRAEKAMFRDFARNYFGPLGEEFLDEFHVRSLVRKIRDGKNWKVHEIWVGKENGR